MVEDGHMRIFFLRSKQMTKKRRFHSIKRRVPGLPYMPRITLHALDLKARFPIFASVVVHGTIFAYFCIYENSKTKPPFICQPLSSPHASVGGYSEGSRQGGASKTNTRDDDALTHLRFRHDRGAARLPLNQNQVIIDRCERKTKTRSQNHLTSSIPHMEPI
jgi:hypothetical protein